MQMLIGGMVAYRLMRGYAARTEWDAGRPRLLGGPVRSECHGPAHLTTWPTA